MKNVDIDAWTAFYNKCWDILVEHGSASESGRTGFLISMLSLEDCKEYRFQGKFGFGGKFRRNGNREGFVHITYYPEDHTDALDAAEELVNEKLWQLQMAEIGGPISGPPSERSNRSERLLNTFSRKLLR